MNPTNTHSAASVNNRRDFLRKTGSLAAGATLAGASIPAVHAAEDNTIRLALVGCGGRGTGAVGNALSTTGGPVKLVAMADLFENRLTSSFKRLKKRFGDRIDGIFLTDDWGTQQGTFVGRDVFERFFAPRYAKLFDAVKHHGWHAILHSCGRINDFVPRFIELGVDVLNMQQPRAYGLVEFGRRFSGRVCFLTTVDIQSTLPRGVEEEIREEARLLVENWGTPQGGLIVFNYGMEESLGVDPRMTVAMFDEFVKMAFAY